MVGLERAKLAERLRVEDIVSRLIGEAERSGMQC
jgi:hypothetical protein